MHSNKGVYALLLGSGVSRLAGIPTGWEVVLDLIRKLAHIQGANCEPDPAAWYADNFQEDANYSKLLDSVAKRPSERSQLLRSYFEPNEDERQRGVKTPTDAHKAIAKLVGAGYIRVIITTNFDRLIEKALEDVGVVATVISTPDAAQGALPLTHTRCTIVKVHGDYLDTRIKNTPEELSTYNIRISRLLDRIFDDYGLIVCGWSAEWDTALRISIERCKSRRFATYWALKGNMSDPAKALIDLRQAQIIPISSADSFFDELEEKVESLIEYDRPHPLSAKVAVVTMKKYMEEDKYKIRLHDLIMQEVEKVHDNTAIQFFPTGEQFSPEELSRRVQKYDSLIEILQTMMITGAYWGNLQMGSLITKGLERLTDSLGNQSGIDVWHRLQLYPALVLMYSAGLASLGAMNYETLAFILLKPQNRFQAPGPQSLILSLSPGMVMETGVGRQLPKHERQYFPLSEHLFETLAGPLKEYIPDQKQFDETFDRLEFFWALVFTDFSLQASKFYWIPVGRFGWKYANDGYSITQVIKQEIEQYGENWLPLKAGFFGGSVERALKALNAVIEFLNHRGGYLAG
jgi:hypothetical protein